MRTCEHELVQSRTSSARGNPIGTRFEPPQYAPVEERGDQTEPVYALNQCFEPMRPRSYFNSSTGYGALAYALPAGIGAKLVAPDPPVVVLVGDGGLQFSIGEKVSAVEAKTPLVLLL